MRYFPNDIAPLAIYRLSIPSVAMDTNEFFSYVVMFGWSFEVLWEIKGEQYVIALSWIREREEASVDDEL